MLELCRRPAGRQTVQQPSTAVESDPLARATALVQSFRMQNVVPVVERNRQFEEVRADPSAMTL